LNQVIKFLQQLQTKIFLIGFSDIRFQSIVAIPQITLNKCPEEKCWVGTVWLVNDFFCCPYPFYIPNLFQGKLTKDEEAVRVKFLTVFLSKNIHKEFLIEEFLDFYPSSISNQRKSNIQRYFLEMIQLFRKHNLITNKYEFLFSGSFHRTEELNNGNISKGFVIYENLEF
jgi:hypothetical protein